MCQTADGGFTACGVTYHHGAGATVPDKMYIVKVSASGVKDWEKVYGSTTGNAAGYSIQQTTGDNGYIVSGEIASRNMGGTGATNTDLFLVRTGTKGDSIWSRTYHGAGSTRNIGLSVLQTPDGGYIAGGYAVSGVTSGFLIKVGSQGDSLWTASTGAATAIVSVKATASGDFVACGSTSASGAGGTDALLYRFTTNGQAVWTTTLGGTLNDAGFSVCPTKDNGFIITGYTTVSGSTGNTSIYLVKTDGQGTIAR